MKNELNKRILSALLALLIFVSAFPHTVHSVENETEPTISTEATEMPTGSTEMTEASTESTETTEAPADSAETTEVLTDSTEATEAPTDSTEVTEAPTDSTEATEEPTTVPEVSEVTNTTSEEAMSDIKNDAEMETTASDEAGNTAESCTYCEITVAEDGTVIHADDCNTRFAINASGQVGKNAAFNMDYDYVHFSNSKPAEGFDYNSEDDGKSDYLTAWYDSFDPPLVEITNWFWEVSGCALWYQVRPLAGETLPEGMTTESWLYQTSTNISGDINALVMVSADVLGKNVVFVQATAQMYNDYFEPTPVDGAEMPAMTVVDLCANNAETWYYVDAAEGETWPEAYADYHYVLSTDVVIHTPAEPEEPTEPENPCDCGCENCTGEEGCACKCGQCDFCQQEFEDGPITGSAGGKTVTVSGDKIPAGATVSVSDLSSAAGGDTGIYNIKVMDGDKVWQPAPGETVRVSIPAPAGASTVNVFHFLEDPEIIKYALSAGIAQKYDASGAVNDANYYITAKSVAAYQEAFNTTDKYVVFEVFADVAVSNGAATVDANGFSAFVTSGNSYSPTTPNFESLINRNIKYYVRPGELIVGTGWSLNNGFSITSDPDGYVSFINNDDDAWIQDKSTYFTVSTDAPDGYEFKIRLGGTGLWAAVTFIVETDINYDNVRICVLPYTDGTNPVELSVHGTYDSLGCYYVSSNGNNLTTTNTVYTTTLSNLIDRNAVLASNALQTNTSRTVYGIVDATGEITESYLTDAFDAIKEDILTKFCAEKGLDKDNYNVIPYVVKYEALGSDIGWYINCKLELTTNFILSYDYNEPVDFNYMEHLGSQKKPGDKTVQTHDSNGQLLEKIQTTVDSGNGMIMSMEITENGQKKEYTATFKGWSTDPNAKPGDHVVGVDDNWYEAGEKITLTGDTVLYAIWDTDKDYNTANIQFKKLVTTSDGTDYHTDREFSFEVYTDHNGDGVADGAEKFNGLEYAIYNAAGQSVGIRQKFTATARTFKLKANQYIVIFNVPNLENTTAQYVIKETLPAGYSAPNNGVAYGRINTVTNTSGEFILNYANTIATYPITYNLGNGMSSNNPSSYTVEDAITLDNPTMKGYSFDGWSGTGLNGLSKNVSIPKGSTGSREYTAHWTEIPYTITYNTDGVGTTPADQSFTGASGFTLMTPTAPEGYTFTGWKVTNKDADSNWSTDRIYASVNNGLTLSAGMYGNVTLTAQWDVTISGTIDNSGKIEFAWGDYTDSDTDGAWSYSIHRGAAAGAIITFTPAENYIIQGVAVNNQTCEVTDNTKFKYEVNEDGITEPINIAVTTTRKSYTITWNAGYALDDNGQPTIAGKFADNSTVKTTTVAHGDLPVAPEVPSNTHDDQYTYIFANWTPEITSAAGDITYTAQYTRSDRKYTVVVKIDPDQVEIRSQGEFTQVGETLQMQVPYNTLLEITFVPKPGYKLTTATVNDVVIGTFTNRFNDYIKGDTIIEVKSERIEYRVSYDVSNIPGGGSAAGDTTADRAAPGETVELNTIEWTGNDVGLYKFAGWVADGNSSVIYQAGDDFTMPERDVTMTAVWHTRYTVSHYYSYNNKLIAQEFFYGYAEVGSEVKVFANNPLKKDEYVCKDKDGNVITEAVLKVKDNGQSFIMFEYMPKMYTITFKNTDGSVVDGIEPIKYCVETEDFTLPNPARKGYTFTGWTGTDLDAATKTVTVPKGSTGDREYTAHWETLTLTIRQKNVASSHTVFYQITGADFGMTVSISGNDSVTIEGIPAGEYTVQEFGNWTWTYSGPQSATVTVSENTPDVEFGFGSSWSRWLHDEAHN